MGEKGSAAARLRDNLAQLRRLRAGAASTGRLIELKRWQVARLTRTYADLLEIQRYRAAARFFIDELYGPFDVTQRDRDLERLYPAMPRLMPETALEIIAAALDLDVLSETLDREMAAILHRALAADGELDSAAYAAAYRACGRRADRERQIELVHRIGHDLDRMVRIPMIDTTLRVMRRPARIAGLGHLQAFLERGFAAFRGMRGAAEFLGVIVSRENEILDKLFGGAAPSLPVES